MRAGVIRWLRRGAVLLAVSLLTFLAVRVYDSVRGPPLRAWHTYVPQELKAPALDAADWAAYLGAEAALFEAVRLEVMQEPEATDRLPINRYVIGSPVDPAGFAQDWNRSYVLEPDGPPQGAVVLLHGLTDSPYSLRHIARRYRAHGFVAVAIRLPGHGTVPAGLTDITWEDWSAATRLAVREARRRIGPGLPLHLIGFSNGGALALQYALDALDDAALSRPDRLVLISPMIGITAFARFAGLAGLPAIFPAFAKAAWLSLLPEFNPFKYNSFPINGARQSHLLTQALQQQITAAAREGRLGELPPVLTFQSVVDFTVSTRAIVSALYAQLPENGSELVLFDLNRTMKFGPLLRPAFAAPGDLLPPPPRPFTATIVANEGFASAQMVERAVAAGAEEESVRALDLSYPSDVFSLSHVALPFPPSDGLYGSHPDPAEDYGINLGAIAARGERGALIVSLDALLRMSSNPFFPYMLARIEEGIPPPPPTAELRDEPAARLAAPAQVGPPGEAAQVERQAP
jgi:alpha-beta hydrolase superfamily lysophospholipase